MYDGHQFLKIDNTWVFDLTEYKGYKVKVKDNIVSEYTKAFRAIETEDNNVYFDKFIEVPLIILKKVIKIIRTNNEDMLVCKSV